MHLRPTSTPAWNTLVAVAALLNAANAAAPAVVAPPAPFKVPARMPDRAEPLPPASVRLEGWLGDRVAKNAQERLAAVDLEPLLAGFRQKPGVHPWIGEHIGKWMHAATLAWGNTGNPELRRKLDYAAAELIQAQEPDGYLGTYLPGQRFGLYPQADWDVWSHKYCLIGLLTYHQYTGSEPALAAARKAGDLLLETFGPGKKSILSAGTHVGMAATSVLEPMVGLYRFTGEVRYLDFCRYLVAAWNEPNGPKIISALLATGQVNRTANGKAYEMLSNLAGLCELARVTGDRQYLEPALIAWKDIVLKRLYLTGSASQGEHFHEDFSLPNDPAANVAETCVTTTWIQLNSQLMRLTGEARFANELERTFYNHLAAAQRPDGRQWCYFTALEGAKPYGPGVNCCVSSGPRGMALAPQQTYWLKPGQTGEAPTVLVGVFEPSQAEFSIAGHTVQLEQRLDLPAQDQGVMTLRFATAGKTRFALAVRQPDWVKTLRFSQADGPELKAEAEAGWLTLPAREWNDGDQVQCAFRIGQGLVTGTHGNQGRSALAWGPFVLAYDEAQNPEGEKAPLVAFARGDNGPELTVTWTNSALRFHTQVRSPLKPAAHPAVFVPFADAGGSGGRYRVWLPGPETDLATGFALTLGGTESRSRLGNLNGSINDGDPATAVVTFDGSRAEEDWFAVRFDAPVEIKRVGFVHGRTLHDGGWFDVSAGKPRIQVQRQKDGAWETVGELADYPATTASDARSLKEGQRFAAPIGQAMKIVAVRIVGKPACGDNPSQAFSSCAELEAFAP